jgi:glycosyltransferase involved in cell wall biosynthesis
MIEPPKIAICAIAKNEALYIEEWIAFHLLQGVSNILIFDNESTDGLKEILGRVAQHVPVEAVHWPGNNQSKMQMEAYREGAKNLIGRADWVAFIDIDEFIFSSRQYSLPMELAEFGPEVGAIAVGHRIFGSSGHTTYEPEMVTSRFVRCARSDHPQSRWFKTLARPAFIESFDSAHSVVLRAGTYLLSNHTPLRRSNYAWHPGYADQVGHGTISLFHYMVKSLEEFRWKQIRFHGKNREHRLDDKYFHTHDDIGNEIENEELRGFAEPIRAMISQWQ